MTDTEVHEHFMQLAIAKAREGVAAGQTPFGACVVRDGRVLSCAHNVVWQDTDITAHAEINAIRQACRALGSIDLSGAVIYSTCEPCPMCFSACHWARIARIVYGASIADARDSGFHELEISNADLKARGGSPVEITGGVLLAENQTLFAEWLSSAHPRRY